MFERELIDSMFVQRWGIVRTLMPQSIAEHSYLVAHYANDISTILGLSPVLNSTILKYALWHDLKDEIFTGDLPGPNKRGLLDAIGSDAKRKWDTKLFEWAKRTFERLADRAHGPLPLSNSNNDIMLLTVKTADWLEAATRMATEFQMGNKNAERHIVPNANGAIETGRKLCHLALGSDKKFVLDGHIYKAVEDALNGASIGPCITKEDERRTFHDPCVDSTEEAKGN